MLPKTESQNTEELEEILAQEYVYTTPSFDSKLSSLPTFIILLTEQPYKQHVSLTENETTHYRQHNTL